MGVGVEIHHRIVLKVSVQRRLPLLQASVVDGLPGSVLVVGAVSVPAQSRGALVVALAVGPMRFAVHDSPQWRHAGCPSQHWERRLLRTGADQRTCAHLLSQHQQHQQHRQHRAQRPRWLLLGGRQRSLHASDQTGANWWRFPPHRTTGVVFVARRGLSWRSSASARLAARLFIPAGRNRRGASESEREGGRKESQSSRVVHPFLYLSSLAQT